MSLGNKMFKGFIFFTGFFYEWQMSNLSKTGSEGQMCDEIQEIIGRTPGGIVRWGMTSILLVVLLFYAVACVIEYPEVVLVKVIVASTTDSAIVSHTEGSRILVERDSLPAGGRSAALPAGILVARADLPADYSNKVKSGQHVTIRLDSYPSEEYGTVVDKVSTLQGGDAYVVIIKLPEKLLTSLKYKLESRPRLSGTATIVVDDLLLIERIFYGLKKPISGI